MAIKIKEKQLKKLEPYALDNYISELVVHCDECYPYLRKTMEESRLRQVLKDCVEKAEQSGFTQRGPVQFYIDMMIAFGAGFETDPQYPWIQKALADNKHLSQIEQSSRLHRLTSDYFDQILGPQSQHFFEAAEKIEQLNVEELHVYKTGFSSYMLKIMQECYPQKYETSGAPALAVLIEQAEQKALQSYGIDQARPTGVIVLLMYLLGHQFDHDPFYSWARLEKTSSYVDYTLVVDNAMVMARKLASRGKIWLRAAVENEKAFLSQQDSGQGGIS